MPDDASPAAKPLVGDGLANVATGQGLPGRDKLAHGFWHLGARLVSPQQIEAAYRTSWLVRRVHDVIPSDMVKNWRAWNLKGAETDKLADEEKRLQVRAVMREGLRLGRLRGGAAVVMGLPGNPAEPAPKTIAPGQLKYLWVTTRDWLTVPAINRDLTSDGFGQPEKFVLSAPGMFNQDVHPSRVLVFKGMPGAGFHTGMSEIDEFWGYPLLESLNECVQNAHTAMDGIAAMIPEAMVDIISIPNLTSMVSTSAGETMLAKRLQVAKLMRSQFQAALMDAGDGTEGSGETWETRQLTFAGLPELMNSFLQFVAGAAGMPFTKLVGAPPEGMNATGEHDERNYEGDLKTRQDAELRPNLEALDVFLTQSAGVKDPKATFNFNPLHESTPEEQGELDNLTADTFNILQTTGLIQHDALAKTLVAVLNARPTFPGLAENVDASTLPLPAEQEAQNATLQAQAKAVAPVMGANAKKPGQGAMRATRRAANAAAKSAKDAGMVNDAVAGVRTLMLGDEVVSLRAVSLAELRDAVPRSLYVSRKLLNPQELLNHFRAQLAEEDRSELMAAGDLHVTVIASTNEVDWMRLPADWSSDQRGRLLVRPGGPRAVSRLGDYLVQEFASDDLRWRFDSLVAAGVEPRWPDFKPHVSFLLDQDGDDALEPAPELKPYQGRLLFGPEIFEQVI